MYKKKDFPYDFDDNACKTCGGKCCRGRGGYVWVSGAELDKIANSKKMDIAVFIRQYVRQVNRRFALTEYIINGECFCCFFDRISCLCTVYDNRPMQCRTYPFWNVFKDDFHDLFTECPGVVFPVD